MNLFKRGAAILVMVALIISFSGCLSDTPAPGAQAIPVPIPAAYIQDGAITSAKIGSIAVNNSQIAANTVNNTQIRTNAINDTQLAANALPYNITTNTTTGFFLGTSFQPIFNNGSITINRTSMVVVQWSGEVGVNGTGGSLSGNSSYMIIQLGTINMSSVPYKLVTNGTETPTTSTSRTVVAYNASVAPGTYTIVPWVNGSVANTNVTIGRNVMVTIAYPHN